MSLEKDGRPVRVLHLLDSLDPGGAQQVVLGMTLYLDRALYLPEVACLHGMGINAQAFQALDIPVHSLSASKYFPSYLPNLYALLRKKRFAILHCHLIASTCIGGLIGAAAGVPLLIAHEHSDYASRKLPAMRLMVSRRIRRLFHHHFAVSPSAREHLCRVEGVPESRVTILENGVDAERFQPRPHARHDARARLGISPSARVVAGVGRLSPVKDYQLFLEVAAQVEKALPGTIFLIAGEGSEEACLRQRASALGLSNSVRFLGHVSSPEDDVYPAADLLLMTSRHEGRPMALLESMACGIPAVAPAIAGISEVVDSGMNGLLTSREATALSAACTALLGDDAQRAEMGSAAAFKAATTYSAARMTRQLESVYESLLR